MSAVAAIDPFSAPYLQGASIDFVNGIQEAGFKIENPNVSSACGCGHSFQVDEGETPERCPRLRLRLQSLATTRIAP